MNLVTLATRTQEPPEDRPKTVDLWILYIQTILREYKKDPTA